MGRIAQASGRRVPLDPPPTARLRGGRTHRVRVARPALRGSEHVPQDVEVLAGGMRFVVQDRHGLGLLGEITKC